MAKITFTNREKMIWLRNENNMRASIANTCNQLAGDLGGYGIDLIDEDGNDLSFHGNDDYTFQYACPENIHK